MKKCPFCAEEIQPEAIKCRYCGSWMPGVKEGEAGKGKDESASVSALHGKLEKSVDASGGGRKLFFEGRPSWRAFLRGYVTAVVAGVVFAVIVFSITGSLAVSTGSRALLVALPLVLAGGAFATVELVRRSLRYRISSHNIETEYGVLRKRIDSVELWRGRDVRYNQSLVDRLLRISHIQVYTTDKTTPEIVLKGMPASRRLFEHIRDAIDIQRQARNVIGMVE